MKSSLLGKMDDKNQGGGELANPSSWENGHVWHLCLSQNSVAYHYDRHLISKLIRREKNHYFNFKTFSWFQIVKTQYIRGVTKTDPTLAPLSAPSLIFI